MIRVPVVLADAVVEIAKHLDESGGAFSGMNLSQVYSLTWSRSFLERTSLTKPLAPSTSHLCLSGAHFVIQVARLGWYHISVTGCAINKLNLLDSLSHLQEEGSSA